jgi:hypothetical protein
VNPAAPPRRQSARQAKRKSTEGMDDEVEEPSGSGSGSGSGRSSSGSDSDAESEDSDMAVVEEDPKPAKPKPGKKRHRGNAAKTGKRARRQVLHMEEKLVVEGHSKVGSFGVLASCVWLSPIIHCCSSRIAPCSQ